MSLDLLSKQLFLDAAPFFVSVNHPLFPTWQRVYQELATNINIQDILTRLLNTAVRNSDDPKYTMAIVKWITADVDERLPRIEDNVAFQQLRKLFNTLISSKLFKQKLIDQGIDSIELQELLLQRTPEVSPASSWSNESLRSRQSSRVMSPLSNNSSATSSQSSPVQRIALTGITNWTPEMVFGAVYDIMIADDGPLPDRMQELQWIIDNALNKLTWAQQMQVVNSINNKIAFWSAQQRESRYNIWKMWTNNNDLLRNRRLEALEQEETAMKCTVCNNETADSESVLCTSTNCKIKSHLACIKGDATKWTCPTCSLKQPVVVTNRPVNVLVARKKTTAAAPQPQVPQAPQALLPDRNPMPITTAPSLKATTPPRSVESNPYQARAPVKALTTSVPRGEPPAAPQLSTWTAEPILRNLQFDPAFDAANEEIQAAIKRAPTYVHPSPEIWNTMAKDAQIMTAISNKLDLIAGSRSVLSYINYIKQQVQYMLNPKTTRPIRIDDSPAIQKPVPVVVESSDDDDLVALPYSPIVKAAAAAALSRKRKSEKRPIEPCLPSINNTVDISQIDVPNISKAMQDQPNFSRPESLLPLKEKQQYRTKENDPLLAFSEQIAADIPKLPLQIAPNDADAERKIKLLHWTKCLREAVITIDNFRQIINNAQLVNEVIHTIQILTDGVCRYVQTPKYNVGVGTYLEVMALQAERQITSIYRTYPAVPQNNNRLCGVVSAFAS
jgi:hypothetical protein